MTTKSIIWDQYSQKERDLIAGYLSDFGHYRTNHHNWRLFNMMTLTFLKLQGYKIDEGVLKDHITSTLSYYVGHGWYRDGHLFDYYSPWTFQFYGPLWNAWYGYQYEAELAALIEERSNKLMENYHQFFDKDAHMMMWGRSNIYRSTASSPFAANLLLKKSSVDPGLARRILSGNLLQFIGKEELFINGLPSLGFYGPFQPLIQTYSCATSPFWFGNAFICLSFADDSPFWTAEESNGIWEGLGAKSETITLDGPGISITNHGPSGTTEMRTSKIMMESDHPWQAEYSRLAFNTKFLWEDLDSQGPEAMQYSLRYGREMTVFSVPNVIMYGGERGGVLYRRAYFDFVSVFKDSPSIDLADIPVDNGMIRVDRVRIPEKPYTLKLGHYGLPHIDGNIEVETRQNKGVETTIAKTKGLQLALIPYHGWDYSNVKQRTNKNAISQESTLIYATSKRDKMYGYEGYILITALLHKTDDQEWQDDQIDPIKKISFEDPLAVGNFGTITITLQDGKEYVVDFDELEGKLMI